MREIVHLQAGQCGNQIGAKVGDPCDDFGGRNFKHSIAKNWVLPNSDDTIKKKRQVKFHYLIPTS